MEPYESELLKAWPIFDKVVLEGTIVAVLCSIIDNRGITKNLQQEEKEWR